MAGEQLLLFDGPAGGTVTRAPPRPRSFGRGGEPLRLFADARSAVIAPCRRGWIVLGPRDEDQARRAVIGGEAAHVVRLAERAWRIEPRMDADGRK